MTFNIELIILNYYLTLNLTSMIWWVVYILTNPSFPQYVKIGYADDLEKRLVQLNRSECIPFAFRIYAYYRVDKRLSDVKIHSMIDKINPNLRAIEVVNWKKRVREFYAMNAEDAYLILETIADTNWMKKNLVKVNPTKKEQESENFANEVIKSKKAKQFSFHACWIKDWEEVVYVKDNSKKAVVIWDKKVKYWNDIMTLTWLAKKLLNKKSGIPWPDYFSYNWKKLNDIRREKRLINF